MSISNQASQNGSDPPKDLPANWEYTTIGDITESITKVQPKDDPQKEFVYLDISSIDNQSNEIVEPKRYIGKEAPSRARQLVQTSDVLFSTVRTYLRNIAPVPEAFDGQVASTGFSILRGKPSIDSRYLLYFTLSDELIKRLSKIQRGTSYPAIRDSDMREQQIPLAPIPEQQRIVAKIEELFTQLDAGVATLQRAQTNLKRYKASLLKTACEGRLVPTEAQLAHDEGRDYEPADVLLERILTERRAKWEADLRAAGKDPVKRKYKEPAAPDTSDLPELPEGWMWTSFGETFDVHVGATPRRSKSEYWEGEIPWVSSGEVSFCRIKDTKEKITNLGLENTSTDLHPVGTVLLGMIGEGKTRGQAAILDIPAAHNQNSAAIKVSEAGLPPEYVYYVLVEQYEKTRTLGSGNNQPALNKSRVQAMTFALPPLTEQERIIFELEKTLSVIDEIDRSINVELSRSERLRQAILKRAFAGQLVPQDPDDEPASTLLESIKEKTK